MSDHNYNRVAKSQHLLKSEWPGLRSACNRAKAMLTHSLVHNARVNELGNTYPLQFLDMCSGRGGDFLKWHTASKLCHAQTVVWAMEKAHDAVVEANRRVQYFKSEEWCTYVPIELDVNDYKGELEPKLCGATFHFCMNYIWSQNITLLLRSLSTSLFPGSYVSVIFTNLENIDFKNKHKDVLRCVTPHSYQVNIGKLIENVEEKCVDLQSLICVFQLAGFRLVKHWQHLSEVSNDPMFKGQIKHFQKPPLPITAEEVNVMGCYSACLFRKKLKNVL
jgi:hypothetical protein